MDELDLHEEEWVERARWIVYEQSYEAEADRWSNPHVSSLTFHSIVVLKKCIEYGKLKTNLVWLIIPSALVILLSQQRFEFNTSQTFLISISNVKSVQYKPS